MNQIDSKEKFKSVIDVDDIIIIQFHVEYCGPCAVMEIFFNEIAEETDYTVFQVNVDENKWVSEYDIMTNPTTVIYQNGTEEKRYTSMVDKDDIVNYVDNLSKK